MKLDVDFGINKVKGKIKFIKYKLYPFLKKTDLRTRQNLWVVFCKPLIRMYFLVMTIANSEKARSGMDSIKRYSRWSLREFMLLPRNADTIFIDFLCRIDEDH